MTLLSTLSTLTLLLPIALAGRPCGDGHHPSANNAISKFCGKSDMVVPSLYTNAGAKGYNGGDQDAHIWISGNCVPPQWLPSKYCSSQFNAMCANDETERKFGNGGCQTWHISYVTPAATPAPSPKPAPAPAAPAKPPNEVTVRL